MACARLYQRGRVLRLDRGAAHIDFESLGGCSACTSGDGCGIAVIASMTRAGSRTALRVETGSRPNVAVGDLVQVGIDARRLLQLVFETYCVPLIGIASGAVAVSLLLPDTGDAGALLGSVGGGLVAGVLLFVAERRRRSLGWLGARITRMP